MNKFDYGKVFPLKDSIADKKMQTNLKFILSLSVDDLLFNYRKNAGLPTRDSNMSISPKIYEGKSYNDISVIKSVSVIKAV